MNAAPTRTLPAPGSEGRPLLAWTWMIGRTVAASLLVAVASLAAWSLLPILLGLRADVVMSDSMAPRIRAGDIVLAAPATAAEVQTGQVILFTDPARPERTVIHRLVRREADGSLITKGDANQGEDSTPVPPALVRALPRLRVPWIGLPPRWIHEGDLAPLLAAAGGLILATLAAGTGSHQHEPPAPAVGPARSRRCGATPGQPPTDTPARDPVPALSSPPRSSASWSSPPPR